MGLVKLGDASTWKTTESLPSRSGAAAAAVAGAAAAPPGMVRLTSTSASALPPAPKRQIAWPDGKISVKYPAGYDPATRSFSRDGGAGAAVPSQAVKRTLPAGVASSEEGAAEAERRRKRAARFGSAGAEGGGGAAAPAAAAAAAEGEAYEATYARAQAEQARLRAQFATAKREAQEQAQMPAAPVGGVLSRLALPGAALPGATRAPLATSAKLSLSLAELSSRR